MINKYSSIKQHISPEKSLLKNKTEINTLSKEEEVNFKINNIDENSNKYINILTTTTGSFDNNQTLLNQNLSVIEKIKNKYSSNSNTDFRSNSLKYINKNEINHIKNLVCIDKEQKYNLNNELDNEETIKKINLLRSKFLDGNTNPQIELNKNFSTRENYSGMNSSPVRNKENKINIPEIDLIKIKYMNKFKENSINKEINHLGLKDDNVINQKLNKYNTYDLNCESQNKILTYSPIRKDKIDNIDEKDQNESLINEKSNFKFIFKNKENIQDLLFKFKLKEKFEVEENNFNLNQDSTKLNENVDKNGENFECENSINDRNNFIKKLNFIEEKLSKIVSFGNNTEVEKEKLLIEKDIRI